METHNSKYRSVFYDFPTLLVMALALLAIGWTLAAWQILGSNYDPVSTFLFPEFVQSSAYTLDIGRHVDTVFFLLLPTAIYVLSTYKVRNFLLRLVLEASALVMLWAFVIISYV